MINDGTSDVRVLDVRVSNRARPVPYLVAVSRTSSVLRIDGLDFPVSVFLPDGMVDYGSSHVRIVDLTVPNRTRPIPYLAPIRSAAGEIAVDLLNLFVGVCLTDRVINDGTPDGRKVRARCQ